MFGRNLNVDVDVNESSGSDWDCESDNVEDGEALVRMWLEMLLTFKMLSFQSLSQSVISSKQVKECVLLLQRMTTSRHISQVLHSDTSCNLLCVI
jgi:hypothetical protein